LVVFQKPNCRKNRVDGLQWPPSPDAGQNLGAVRKEEPIRQLIRERSFIELL